MALDIYRFKKFIKGIFKKQRKILKKKADKIDYKLLESCVKHYQETEASIDRVTWQDLDMDKVFAHINETTTTSGEETLYAWLHHPSQEADILEQRKEVLRNIAQSEETMSEVRQELHQLGYIHSDFQEMIKNGFYSHLGLRIIFILLSTINMIMIGYSLVAWSTIFIPFIALSFLGHAILHYTFSNKIAQQMDCLPYMMRLLSRAKVIAPLMKATYPELSSQISETFRQLKTIYKKGGAVMKLNGVDVIGDYMNILFLLKERSYLAIAQQVNTKKEILLNLFQQIGEVDALMSIALYRKSLNRWCEPQYLKDKDGEHQLRVESMYHPLIKEPVANHLITNKNIVITGSNMSGKSTFLRTLALNVLFSQSIVTVLSDAYENELMKVISSINLSDNLLEETSYFMMEAEVVKKMINAESERLKTLVLIDEIFRGTNPVERIAAAIEILNHFEDKNVLAIVATHDLEIVHGLNDYERYYFTEDVSDTGMHFEYKLHPGIVPSRNAVKILRYLQYPQDLLFSIEERLQ